MDPLGVAHYLLHLYIIVNFYIRFPIDFFLCYLYGS